MTSCLFLTFILSITTTDAIDVGGPIWEDTSWDLSGSPYNLVDDVLVKEGTTLKIEPGVEVNLKYVQPTFTEFNLLRIDGKLIAQGTNDKKIIFNGGYIIFSDLSVDATFDDNGNYKDGCVLQHITYEASNGGFRAGFCSAIIIESSSVFIDHCIIWNNDYGNGIGIYSGSAKITNNIISKNCASRHINGGGIYVENAETVIIEGNTITENVVGSEHDYESLGKGGGVFITGTGVIIENNILSNNITYSGLYGSNTGGGGIYVENGRGIVIQNNTIKENKAYYQEHKQGGKGGGIFVMNTYGESPNIIKNNIISNNTADNDGGGIYINGSDCIIENNVIVENTGYDGAGIYSLGCTIKNNTISRNIAERLYSAVFYNGSNNDFSYNSITDNNGGMAIYISGNPHFNYNNINNNIAYKELGYIGNGGALDAKNCWWGTSDKSEIWQKIENWEEVDYYPFLTEPETDAPVIPPMNLEVTTSSEGSLSLTWSKNQESDLNGYKVYYDTDSEEPYNGTGAEQGNSPIDVGNVASFNLSNLALETYYIAITANDIDGNASWYSRENSINPFPELTTTTTISPQPCTSESIYGEDSEATELLRYVRDEVLSKTTEGQEIIRLYYQWSPMIVKAMKKDEEFKDGIKEMIEGILSLIRGKVE